MIPSEHYKFAARRMRLPLAYKSHIRWNQECTATTMDARPLLHEVERPFVRKAGKTAAEEWKIFKDKSDSDFEISVICNVGFIAVLIALCIIIENLCKFYENASVESKSSIVNNAVSIDDEHRGTNDLDSTSTSTSSKRVPRIQFQHFRKKNLYWMIYVILSVVIFLYLQVHYSFFM